MSRIGKKPIAIPDSIKVAVSGESVLIEGPKGKLSLAIPRGIKIEAKGGQIIISRTSDEKQILMNHGLIRALVNNMVKGISEGYTKELEVIGVGFKAQITGKKLVLNLGFSHPIEYDPPEGVTIEAPKPNQIFIKGIDKQAVGAVAAKIRDFYKPEPYKGKGIRYSGEYVRKKAGKTVA